jgi:hypothetical protein
VAKVNIHHPFQPVVPIEQYCVCIPRLSLAMPKLQANVSGVASVVPSSGAYLSFALSNSRRRGSIILLASRSLAADCPRAWRCEKGEAGRDCSKDCLFYSARIDRLGLSNALFNLALTSFNSSPVPAARLS